MFRTGTPVLDLRHRWRPACTKGGVLDVLVVGGGPAGLSAALMLARCRRSVAVIDAGAPRNARSRGVHGFFTRDGILPADLLRRGREELARYGVEVTPGTIVNAAHDAGRFRATLDGDGAQYLEARRLLLATGVVDCLPPLAGIDACYGVSAFHCPYCDGWEVRDQPLAVYGHGRNGVGLSMALQTWSRDVVLCTDGPARLPAADVEALRARRIPVRREPIAELRHRDGYLEQVAFRSGESIARSALFFVTGQYTRSPLAERLGCRFTRKGAVQTNNFGETCVKGLYVAGDASRDVQFVVVAAAEGAKVAYAINVELQREDSVG
jgi:thioredoxin reductase